RREARGKGGGGGGLIAGGGRSPWVLRRRRPRLAPPLWIHNGGGWKRVHPEPQWSASKGVCAPSARHATAKRVLVDPEPANARFERRGRGAKHLPRRLGAVHEARAG